MPNVLGKLLLLSVVKKVTLFMIARTYGFPRLYRRIMEQNRRWLRGRPEARTWVRDRVQTLFRLPRTLAQRMQRKIREQEQTTKGLLLLLTAMHSTEGDLMAGAEMPSQEMGDGGLAQILWMRAPCSADRTQVLYPR
ncbi:hypothetical protein CDCA_CDCA08G2381 [Cyanidium caldarium]|uniref:Uncharacterized protein n=1 Tax=Cyanidium caldarium TaxID=2771 RepID=A0AAV9IW70_CYACA|nr:hypothetical protein CDCA_CDCA08G2381 [Cyanidium caldarium]